MMQSIHDWFVLHQKDSEKVLRIFMIYRYIYKIPEKILGKNGVWFKNRESFFSEYDIFTIDIFQT